MTEIGIKRTKKEMRIGGKDFNFYLIPVIVEEYLIKHDEVYSEIGKKIKDSKDFENLGILVNERNKACGVILFDTLKAFIEANGYEFDEDWWKLHIDYQGILEIITDMKVQEYTEKNPQKKKELLSGE